MPRPEYYSLRVPAGTTDRIRRLADPMGISVAAWVHRAIRRHAVAGYSIANVIGRETIAIAKQATCGFDAGEIRLAIAIGLIESESRAPRPPVIDPAEQEAARGAVVVDAMDYEQ